MPCFCQTYPPVQLGTVPSLEEIPARCLGLDSQARTAMQTQKSARRRARPRQALCRAQRPRNPVSWAELDRLRIQGLRTRAACLARSHSRIVTRQFADGALATDATGFSQGESL